MRRHAILPTALAVVLALSLAPVLGGETARPGAYAGVNGFNGLNKFRNLQPGATITVPPLLPAVHAAIAAGIASVRASLPRPAALGTIKSPGVYIDGTQTRR